MRFYEHSGILHTRNLVSIVVLTLTAALSSPAQREAHQLRTQAFSVEEDLSQNSIWASLQDRRGFLWFGTADGLNRYDGYTFTVFRTVPGDSSTLSSNTIWALTQDDSGTIWIGNNNGVDRFDIRTATFTRAAADTRFAGLPLAEMTTSILADKAGNIWCGRFRGIFYFHPASGTCREFTPAELPPESGPAGYRVLLLDRAGDVWLTNGARLYRFTHGTQTLQRIPFGPKDVRTTILSMFEDKEGSLWFATREGGLWQHRRGSGEWKTILFRDNAAPLGLSAVHQDWEGRLWIGTTAHGLYYSDPGSTTFRSFRPSPQGTKNARYEGTKNARYEGVKNILRDRSGLLWVGYDGAGLIRINPHQDKFLHVLLPPSSAAASGDNFYKALVVDRSKNIWLGTYDQGLNVLEPSGKVRRYRYSQSGNGLRSNTVLSLQEGPDGDMWVGTLNGIDRFVRATGRFRHYNLLVAPGQPVNVPQMIATAEEQAGFVTWLCGDSSGAVWAGTARQILKYDPLNDHFDEVLSISKAFSLPLPPMINVITPALHGILWVGTMGGGMLKMTNDGTILKRYTHSGGPVPSLSNNSVKTILIAPDGILWIGTEGGLNRFDPATESWRAYHKRDGLPNDVVYGLLMDDKRRLWISTNRGIARMETADAGSPRFRNYTPEDGLQSYEFNTNVYYKSPDGEMFFGGVNGFNRFHPDSIRDNPVVPAVILTGFKKFDIPVQLNPDISTTSDIVLQHDESVFSIEFAAAEFTNPRANLYRYKLEGFDKDWVNPGRRREARYTNLDPGQYVFRVKGSNNDGVWNTAGASVRVIIVPPFWKTGWFIGLMVVLGIGTFGGTVRFISTQKLKKRIEQLEREKEIQEERLRTRERIARDLHDDLASTVGSAGFFVESVKNQLKEIPVQSREFLDKTSSLLTEAEEAMSDIVWSVSPEHDTLESLCARIRLTTADLCRASRIEYAIAIPEGSYQATLAEGLRRNLYLIFKEALTNAVRHSGASCINVSLLIEQGQLSLTIHDNGKGLPALQPSPGGTKRGHGMRNMQRRAEEVGATLAITPSSPSGTVVLMTCGITQTGHC